MVALVHAALIVVAGALLAATSALARRADANLVAAQQAAQGLPPQLLKASAGAAIGIALPSAERLPAPAAGVVGRRPSGWPLQVATASHVPEADAFLTRGPSANVGDGDRLFRAPEARPPKVQMRLARLVTPEQATVGAQEQTGAGAQEHSSVRPADFEDLPQDWGWNLDLESFEQIAESEHSRSFKGRLRNAPGREVVLTHMRPEDVSEMLHVGNKIKFMELLQGRPGFLKIYKTAKHESLEPGQSVYLLTEPAAGNLNELVLQKTFDEMPVRTRVRLFADMVRALCVLQRRGIVHRDIVPENVLIMGDCKSAETCSAVICGFWNACFSGGREVWPSTNFRGSEAPEVSTANGDMPPQDVWSLGVVLFQLLLEPGRAPEGYFESVMEVTGKFDVQSDPYYQDVMALDPQLARILRKMLDLNPKRRPTAEEVFHTLEGIAYRNYNVELVGRQLPKPSDNVWSDQPLPRWRIFLRRLAGSAS